jgi:hypothetical protein
VTDTEQKAQQVKSSGTVEALARLGLAARGVVWLVIGLLALNVLLGEQEEADKDGALRAIADKPLGEVLLIVLAVGFAGYAAWRLLSAAVGYQDEDGAKRVGKRLLALGKGLLYAALAVSTVRFLGNQDAKRDKTSSTTAEVMSHDGGRTLVGGVGVVIVAIGLGLAVRAVLAKHEKKIEQWRVPDKLPVVAIGTAGLVGRGLVIALLGGFLLRAAVEFDPREAKGLDAALQTLRDASFGPALLALAVAALLSYALWSFVEAAFRKTDS